MKQGCSFLVKTWGGNKEFFSTLAYFTLININVILILGLAFLIFRNFAKLVLERRKGVLGSKLRTKLVVALTFFALAPTFLLFYISIKYITTSFETWFSEKVQITMEQTKEAGSHVYRQDQKRLQSLARIALQHTRFYEPAESYMKKSSGFTLAGLDSFGKEYGLNNIHVFTRQGDLVWSSLNDEQGQQASTDFDESHMNATRLFLKDQRLTGYSTVLGLDHEDLVRGFAPIRDPYTNQLMGLVVTETRFETQILKSIERIMNDFASLKPGAQLIRVSYLVMMIVIVLLIMFSAIWFGFVVARGISGPLQDLADATKEVSLGNYDIRLDLKTNDEMQQLVHAFNTMTQDLNVQRQKTRDAHHSLQKSNYELDQRRRYMEVVLKNIGTGVMSLNSDLVVTSINTSAETLLALNPNTSIGKQLTEVLSDRLYKNFWMIIYEKVNLQGYFHGQVDLNHIGLDFIFIVHATKIKDESSGNTGFVVVFDNIREQVQFQKVAAWKEVARRIAHEIKNPITPIKLNAQRLLRKFNGRFEENEKDVFESCMKSIINQVDSLRDLVNEFSKFSRLPQSQPKISDITELLMEVVGLYKISYPEVLFDTTRAKQVPKFAIDKEQMNRVFVNIFTNAVAALVAHRVGKISIKIDYLEHLKIVRVEVVDNGCGIPEGLQKKVFEPYFSLKNEGTGLGLAIVHQIVSDHGGYLRLLPNKPNGTIVAMEFPTNRET